MQVFSWSWSWLAKLNTRSDYVVFAICKIAADDQQSCPNFHKLSVWERASKISIEPHSLFASSLGLSTKALPKFSINMKIRVICMSMKTHFSVKGCAIISARTPDDSFSNKGLIYLAWAFMDHKSLMRSTA